MTEFNGNYYLQTCGCAMGRKYSPAYANIYLAVWEEEVFAKCHPTKVFFKETDRHALLHKQSFHPRHTFGTALEELLVSAKKQDCLTVGVYESAKVMNVDPDNVAFCVLATDEEYERDIALQIHFTLIQAFCFDNDINIVRVNDIERLVGIVGTDESLTVFLSRQPQLHSLPFIESTEVLFPILAVAIVLLLWLATELAVCVASSA
ncbi:growth arrest and DNA damage-inducible protein GADD45 alpha-like [Alosa alosa]|uniref:growth arrest and DNA damage-inducible protein GADD45 alpha-like n=1 Tax=Alosa alosa TaxID=278164 RepID=UPI00201513E4|nr:growth arrest and DNA damage-inducible protein GADD45 alpha-like [Alosa alosa]